jgi:hypothetical protein
MGRVAHAVDLGFEDLQAALGPALAANRPGSGTEHVVIALPSYSLGESLLAHYASRIPALEHRYLVAFLMLHRIPTCELVFLGCQPPDPEVLEHYLALIPPEPRARVRSRFRAVTVADRSGRSIAAKLLDQPGHLRALRGMVRGRPAFIEPWNVTRDEVEVALRLQVPVNGTAPHLWPLGFKSAGRRLLAAAEVPVPPGREDVCDLEGVVAAVEAVRVADPSTEGVVVKLDDSGAGEGNSVVDLRAAGGEPVDVAVKAWARRQPAAYLRMLSRGGVVEQLVTGRVVTSPSVQVDVRPGGQVEVLSTHEQVLDGHVYTGCRFPADPAYAAELGRHGHAVGRRLAGHGVVGRFSVDFMAVEDRPGAWRLLAVEINLRKGGTTHPYTVLRNLVPGRYDVGRGCWVTTAGGDQRAYVATDNLVDSGWVGLPPAAVIGAVDGAGLTYDHRRGTGVVLHMLSCLAIDGRLGLTAIGRTPEEAVALYDGAAAAVYRAA